MTAMLVIAKIAWHGNLHLISIWRAFLEVCLALQPSFFCLHAMAIWRHIAMRKAFDFFSTCMSLQVVEMEGLTAVGTKLITKDGN